MNTNEVLHEFRQGPIKVSVCAPQGAKLVIQFKFEFVRVEENGSESKSFDWFSLAALAQAAEAARKWVRDQADTGRL